MSKWQPCRESDIPNDTRFDVPPQNQGQIVEVAYGGPLRSRTPYDWTDAPFKRVHDRSDQSVAYYRRAK